MRVRSRLLATVVLTLAVACGDPEGGVQPFEFDPVPYTVVPRPEDCGVCGEAIAIGPDGTLYYADQVVLLIETDFARAIEEKIDRLGFRLVRRTDGSSLGVSSILVQVPPGAAPDAVSAFEQLDGVVGAAPNYLHGADSTRRPS